MITEPATMITDYLLAVITMILLYNLHQIKPERFFPFKGSFVSVTISSITGGTTHGFVNYLPPTIYTILWKITLGGISIASALIIIGSIQWMKIRRKAILLQISTLIKLVLFLGLIAGSNNFVIVIIDYGISLIFVVGLTVAYFGSKQPIVAKYMLIAFLLSLLIALIWFTRLQLTIWFTHNDISHLIQMMVMYFVYKALEVTNHDFSNK